MSEHKDYYTILGVSPQASREQIAAAYEALARRYQPDPDREPKDPARMREINEAFDILDDPRRRAAYDQSRALALAQLRAERAARAARIPRWLPPALLGGGLIALAAAVILLSLAFIGGSGEFANAVTTQSGLKYVDVVEGTGPAPQAGQIVVLHYVGRIKGGEIFDSTVERQQPFGFQLGAGNVIKGWEEGVATMKVGGRRKLLVPPQLGYGDRGLSSRVPPNATLVYDLDTREGTGPTPQGGQKVTVEYTGWLADTQKKFDSSLDRGVPFSFLLSRGQVIPGWNEGIASMKVGGMRRLIIPPELGYGSGGAPPTIPANATLIFDIELLGVE